MASQVAHIVYAKKYLDQHPMTEADSFILGILFPDIRRVSKEISRSNTHHNFEKLDLDFSELAPFGAGWKFHIWCDMRRNEILNKYSFHSLKYVDDFGGFPARLLEDELLYEKYRNWEKLVRLLNNPPDLKIKLDDQIVSYETLEHWYAIVAKYFEKKPSDKTIKIFISKQLSLKKEASGIIDVLGKLRNNQKVVGILSKISDEILDN
jgi:hypothetical protein